MPPLLKDLKNSYMVDSSNKPLYKDFCIVCKKSDFNFYFGKKLQSCHHQLIKPLLAS